MSSKTTTNPSVVKGNDENDLFHSILGILGSLAVLTNAPLLIVLLKSKTQVFLTRMNYLVASLALADLLTGVAVIMYVCLEYLSPSSNFYKFQLVMIWTTIEASFLTILLMSVERLVVLSYPLTWPLILTTNRTIFGIVLTWLVAMSCGVAVHFFLDSAQFALTVLFEVSVVVAAVLHCIIFRRLRIIRAFSQKFEEIADTTDVNVRQASQPRATKVLLILVVILTLTVLPYMVNIQLLFSIDLGFLPLSQDKRNFLVKCSHYLLAVEITNFIANPIVYAWRLKRYRKAFTETFLSFVCKRDG